MSRTFLLGLDGATFTLLDEFFARGVMPFLKRFADQGVRGTLRSTLCPLTPPAWTTMVTGRSPGNHGVFDFIVVDERVTDRIAFRLASGQDMLAEPVWSIASERGIRSAALNFPATNYAPPFAGLLVPGFVTSRVLKMSVRPRSFWDEIKDLPGFSVQDVSWDLDEGRIPLGGVLDPEAFRQWIDYLIRKETGWFVAARHAVEAHDCGLLCIVFEGIDRLQHQAWTLLDPATRPEQPTRDEQAMIDACLAYFRRLDGLLQQLVECGGDDLRTLFASDHGFGPTREVFYANAWLERHGYLVWRDHAACDQAGALTAHNMREHFESIDWQRTVAYARTTSANGIYIRVAEEPGAPGIPPKDYRRVREEIRRGLLDYLDPDTRSPVVTRVLDRDEAFPGVATRQAPDLTLFLRDQGFLSIMRSDRIVRPRDEVKGTHRPEGVLIAGGPGIRCGQRIGDQDVIGVAATLLYSLGLPVPADFEAPVMSGLFSDEFLRAHHPVEGPNTRAMRPAGEQREKTVEASDENVVLERLKALGYL
jgi:predicted AlkP superfamily phosphohydrolase/phosphomutase